MALFYDELAGCVASGTVDKETVQLIYDKYVDQFQTGFISREPVHDGEVSTKTGSDLFK